MRGVKRIHDFTISGFLHEWCPLTGPIPSDLPVKLDCGCREFVGWRNKRGYGRYLYKKKYWATHRLAWTLQFGAIPKKLLVLHLCNNPACCEPRHLELGDHRRNAQYRDACNRAFRGEPRRQLMRERAARGERAGKAKLTEAQVIEIRQRYIAGEKQRVLAAEYNVSVHEVWSLIRNRLWRHLDYEAPPPLAGGPHGERNGNTKVTEQIVREIRSRHEAGEALAQISPDYNISKSQVWRIIRRERWAYL